MIKIPTPRIPTEEEMIESSTRWFSELNGVKFEDWNDQLRLNSIPFQIIHIPKDLVERTLEQSWNGGKFNELVAEYEDLLGESVNGREQFFGKLNTRSPKDVHDTCLFFNVKGLVKAITGSMRCFDDLCMLLPIDKAAVVIRPAVKIKKPDEWRCFVFEGKLQGITQYFYDQNFLYSELQILQTKLSAKRFIEKIVIPNMKVKSFVVDLIISDTGLLPVIIETNPYGLSDPCLFRDYQSFGDSPMILTLGNKGKTVKTRI